jgi:hypothetical protein
VSYAPFVALTCPLEQVPLLLAVVTGQKNAWVEQFDIEERTIMAALLHQRPSHDN